MTLGKRIDELCTPRVVLIAGWICFVVYAYPGFMTAESVAQLNQARGTQPVTDWHPPMMQLIWHYLDNMIAGPFGMLALQSLSLLLGSFFIFTHFLKRRRAAIAAVVVLLVPNTIVVLSVVTKDALMAGFLVAGIAGLMADRLRWRVVGCVFIFLGTAVRYSAPAATLPLVVLLWDRDLAKAWYTRYGVGFAVWVGITGAAALTNTALVKEGTQPFEVGSAPVDIEGTLHYAPEIDLVQLQRETPDVPWKTGVDVKSLVAHNYDPEHSFVEIYAGEAAIFDKPQLASQADALAALWKRLVREHRGAFLRHRFAVAMAQLDSGIPVWHAYAAGTDWGEEQTHHRSSPSKVQKLWIRGVQKLLGSKIFWPRTFFFLSLVLLVFVRRHRVAATLLLSGLAMELGVFAAAPSIAYEYSHWMVFCAILATSVLVIERARGE